MSRLRLRPYMPLAGHRSPLDGPLRLIAVLALVSILASAAQLTRSHLALDSLRSAVSARLDAGAPCVGAEALASTSCRDGSDLPLDLDPALSATDIGVVEGTLPFIGGCAHHLIGTDVVNKHCVWRTPGATTTIALVGDSHAAQWADALLQVASARRWNVEVYFHGGCLLSDVRGLPSETLVSPQCAAWSLWVGDQLRQRSDLDTVVYGSHAAAYTAERTGGPTGADAAEASADVVDSAVASISAWKGAGRQVLILRDVPALGVDVPRCLASAAAGGARSDPCSVPRAAPTTLDDHESALIAARLELPLIDTTDLFCDESVCHAVVGGVAAYRDDDHITATFARTAGRALADRIDRTAGKK
ncbi:SGNH hydrolase domain-containing protein [Rathayibacter rathayi]|uniref:SGNH hydrolase domain-containing protein n=1 Tax=Rathayibacter rathayi TaxID=33887 RepID=UPI0015E20FC9|nr:SGNH hydrolase domain-containing protein [Rathayibacter rathayi]